MISADPDLGLRWSVVESLPVAEAIKLGDGDLAPLFENYRQSLRNLGGLRDPDSLLQLHGRDWTGPARNSAYVLAGGATALRYNAHEVAAFDCYILERPGSEDDHDPTSWRASAGLDEAGVSGGQGPAPRHHHGRSSGSLSNATMFPDCAASCDRFEGVTP